MDMPPLLDQIGMSSRCSVLSRFRNPSCPSLDQVETARAIDSDCLDCWTRYPAFSTSEDPGTLPVRSGAPGPSGPPWGLGEDLNGKEVSYWSSQ
jgi:hypothetical protein